MTKHEPYSPQRRTALILSGIGTAGAYHAGALRALHEAGVKIDVVGGRGIGVVGALFSAVDGASHLWDERGFWRSPAVARFYAWRMTLQMASWALAASVILVVVPIAAVALGLVVFPIDFLLKMLGGSASGLVAWYVAFAEAAFAPAALPTWLPRLVLIVLGLAASVAAGAAWESGNTRRRKGPFWWRILRGGLDADRAVAHCWATLWDLVRGAAALKQPSRIELARRYIDMLAENIGQPGFRELVLSVHDVDARRDLVFALVDAKRRRSLVRRATSDEAETRRAEIFDLTGVAREYFPDAVAGALAIPLVTDYHTLRFANDSYWSGEEHRVADRPAGLLRLVEEMVDLDVEQILLVSASPESPGPHTLTRPRLDPRGRVGEYLESSESAAVADLARLSKSRGERLPRIFTVCPAHNSIGPFDFGGGFDDRSDRPSSLDELIKLGYADAYHQFIEPVVGASGEQVGKGSGARG